MTRKNGGEDGIRLPKSERNGEYEVKRGEKRSNKAKARECVLLRDKKKVGEPNDGRRRRRRRRHGTIDKWGKKIVVKATHITRTHTHENTNVLSKFILRIAFLTSVWKYINKKKVSRAGARVCSRVHIIHILYIIVISVRRRWLAASASPCRCPRVFPFPFWEIRSLRLQYIQTLRKRRSDAIFDFYVRSKSCHFPSIYEFPSILNLGCCSPSRVWLISASGGRGSSGR